MGDTIGIMPTFAELLENARTGDAAAVDEIVRLYEPDVRLVARMRLGNTLRPYLDSMDLVQSVHRSLIRGLQNRNFVLDDPQQLIHLALTMVRRKAARAWRKQKRQHREDVGLGELLVNLTQPGSGPEDPTKLQDTVQRLNQELDPLDQKILELHLLDYRTVEIARLLQQEADFLRVRLSRLRQKLQALPLFADA